MSSDLYRDRDARLNTVVGDGAAYWAMLSRLAERFNVTVPEVQDVIEMIEEADREPYAWD